MEFLSFNKAVLHQKLMNDVYIFSSLYESIIQ
jgi:hypothetical protein